MSHSFHNADRRTHRKVMLVGLSFCAAFAAISFLAREQPDNSYVLIKADKPVRTAASCQTNALAHCNREPAGGARDYQV